MPTPANSINEATTGISGFTGTAFVGTAVNQYNILAGGATTSTLSNIAPSATSGIPLVSGGSAANPSFTTAVVAGGGTGDTSFTAYAVIAGGTTSTGALQSVASVGTSGQVLTSNGAGALPTFQNNDGIAWTDEGTSFNAVAGNGYFITANATATMPASPSQGNIIAFAVDAAATTVTITANTGQVIRIGTAVSASAGTAANNARGDSVTLVFRSSDNAWIATSVLGTWTVT